MLEMDDKSRWWMVEIENISSLLAPRSEPRPTKIILEVVRQRRGMGPLNLPTLIFGFQTLLTRLAPHPTLSNIFCHFISKIFFVDVDIFGVYVF